MKVDRQSQIQGLCPFSSFGHSPWNICFGKDGVDLAAQGLKS